MFLGDFLEGPVSFVVFGGRIALKYEKMLTVFFRSEKPGFLPVALAAP